VAGGVVELHHLSPIDVVVGTTHIEGFQFPRDDDDDRRRDDDDDDDDDGGDGSLGREDGNSSRTNSTVAVS